MFGLGENKNGRKTWGNNKHEFQSKNSTEVRVQNLDNLVPKLDFLANEKENKQKGKMTRITFTEFMRRNPHFFSIQEDRPNQP